MICKIMEDVRFFSIWIVFQWGRGLQEDLKIRVSETPQKLGAELRHRVRDDAGCIPVLHPCHVQGAPHVHPQVSRGPVKILLSYTFYFGY